MAKPIDAQLLALEMRFWNSMKDKDAEAARALTNDPCILTGAQRAASRSQHVRQDDVGRELDAATF